MRVTVGMGALVIAVVLLLGIGGCAGAKPASQGANSHAAGGEQPIPVDLRGAIQRSSDIGVQLYLLDKVAAVATDVLLANVPNPDSKGLRGYLPFREGDDAGHQLESFRVSFFTGDEPPRIPYDVVVPLEGKPRLEAFEPPHEAPPGFAALVRARQAALAALPPVSQPINPVLLPAEAYGETGTLVYLLAGTKRAGVAVFGKHYLALVPVDGRAVRYVKPLTKSVLEVPFQRVPQGGKLEALFVTHLVTDYPLETHVFTSLLHHLPIMVGTARGVWRVDGRRISYLGKGD